MFDLQRGIVCLASFFVLGCGETPSPASFDTSAVEDTLRRIALAFPNALRTLNADTVIKAFDDELVWVADAYLFPSRDSVKVDAAQRYAGMRSIDFRWDTLRIQALGPDAGVVTGQARAAIVGSDGKPVVVRAGATYVFIRRDGHWKVIHGHASHAVVSQ